MSWSLGIPVFTPECSALPAPDIFEAISLAVPAPGPHVSDEQVAVAKDAAIKIIESRCIDSPDDHYAVSLSGHKHRGGDSSDFITVSVCNRPEPVQ